MKARFRIWLPYLCFITATLGLMHHYVITNGIWFHWGQFLHHEALIVATVTFGLGLIVGSKLKQIT